MGTHVREPESHVPSRRQALRLVGFSGLSAAAPVTAIALVVQPALDTELIRLGEEFDRLHAAWLPLWRESRRASERLRDMLNTLERPLSMDAYHEACCASGVSTVEDQNCVRLDGLRRVADRIRSIPATTFAGLHVKARVVLHESFATHSHDGIADNDMDWDVFCFMQFLREVADLAGEVGA